MIDDNFVFKFGKHSGKSYALVKKTDPGYIKWAEANAPNLLKEKKKVEPKPATPIVAPPESSGEKSIVTLPNLGFFSEKNTTIR